MEFEGRWNPGVPSEGEIWKPAEISSHPWSHALKIGSCARACSCLEARSCSTVLTRAPSLAVALGRGRREPMAVESETDLGFGFFEFHPWNGWRCHPPWGRSSLMTSEAPSRRRDVDMCRNCQVVQSLLGGTWTRSRPTPCMRNSTWEFQFLTLGQSCPPRRNVLCIETTDASKRSCRALMKAALMNFMAIAVCNLLVSQIPESLLIVLKRAVTKTISSRCPKLNETRKPRQSVIASIHDWSGASILSSPITLTRCHLQDSLNASNKAPRPVKTGCLRPSYPPPA